MPYIENLDEIIAGSKRVDVKQFLSSVQPGVKITKSGKELRTACPIHAGSDKDPQNFAINDDDHSFFCHSHKCHGTNLVDLYAQSRGFSKNEFYKAAEEFANKFGIPIKYKENESDKYTHADTNRCWKEAKISGKDFYFEGKRLQPPAIIRFGKNPNGYPSTMIPYSDIEGYLKYIVSIGNDKKKRIYKVTDNISDAFALLGNLDHEGLFYIGEGIATVQTAWESTQRKIPSISCGSWSNIKTVLKAIKNKYGDIKPIVLIDCDEGGKGLEAAKAIANEFPEATFRKPAFDDLPNPKNYSKKELKDFNDIISKCDGTLLEDVAKQLSVEFDISQVKIAEGDEEPKQQNKEQDFYGKLGTIIRDADFVQKLKERNYDSFEMDHKKLFASGGLITGYKEIDEQLYFAKGDFVVVQAMSNHGKSTFMLQLMYKFLNEDENQTKNPMCVFITYESTPIRIEEKFVNILGHECGEGTTILYSRNTPEKYLYPDKKDYRSTIMTFNQFLSQKKINMLQRLPLEKLELLVDIFKAEYPERTLVLFLDYLQIIENSLPEEGWQLMKSISYYLESLAIKKEIIVFAASQVNDKRQAREGRDIYNAATTVIDIFNHSHASLKTNTDLANQYKEPINKKNVCTFSAVKQKHGSSFTLDDYFLFNGYSFEINGSNKSNEITEKGKDLPDQQKKRNGNEQKARNSLMPKARST